MLQETTWDKPLQATGCVPCASFALLHTCACSGSCAPSQSVCVACARAWKPCSVMPHQRALILRRHASLHPASTGLRACRQISKGCFWDVELTAGPAQEAGFIVHSGDDKSAGGELISVDTSATSEVWLVDGYARPFWSEHEAAAKSAGSLSACSAHWCAHCAAVCLRTLPALLHAPHTYKQC